MKPFRVTFYFFFFSYKRNYKDVASPYTVDSLILKDTLISRHLQLTEKIIFPGKTQVKLL